MNLMRTLIGEKKIMLSYMYSSLYCTYCFIVSILQSQSSSSTSVPTSPFCTEEDQCVQPASKKRKSSPHNDVDNLLIRHLQDKAQARKTRQQQDEDDHFGHHVAGVIKRLPYRMKALARLRIEQVLMEVEFPPEPPPTHYSYPC